MFFRRCSSEHTHTKRKEYGLVPSGWGLPPAQPPPPSFLWGGGGENPLSPTREGGSPSPLEEVGERALPYVKGPWRRATRGWLALGQAKPPRVGAA